MEVVKKDNGRVRVAQSPDESTMGTFCIRSHQGSPEEQSILKMQHLENQPIRQESPPEMDRKQSPILICENEPDLPTYQPPLLHHVIPHRSSNRKHQLFEDLKVKL